MKKNFMYALLGAIALTGAVSFSACSSSDEIVDNPDYNPETNTVKTQFAISLGDNIVKTRMSSENTQSEGTAAQFRGFEDILLIPFKSGAAADDNLNGKVIALVENEAADTKNLTNDKNYLYNNVDVKIETNFFTFYAVAKPDSKSGAQVGRLTPTLPVADAATVSMASYGFAPVSIMSSTDYTDAQRTQANNVRDNLIAKLNQVLETTDWKKSTNVTLVQLYNQFKSLRVGSSEGVQTALQNLYTNAKKITGDGATIATAILTAITNTLSSPKGDNVTITADTNGKLTFGAGYNGYPTSIGLPNGSARLAFTQGEGDAADKYIAADSEILWTSTNTTAPGKFVYPADLRYFVQTGIKTAEKEFLKDNLASSWSTITGNSIYTGTSVSGTTRSIVLTEPIQYGVGRLETSIAAMDQTTYYDRKGQPVTIPAGGFTLTGVVIGGQKAVDWQFKPSTGDAYTIYDSDVSGVTTSTTAASAANHTLVLETAAEDKVNIALQFRNDSENEFTGADGIIYPGKTFYLIAELDPKATTGVKQPTGGSIEQVFLQDFVTKVALTINAGTDTDGNNKGFGAALSGLPDLTTSKLEFGLSVNLSWEEGLTFNVNI